MMRIAIILLCIAAGLGCSQRSGRPSTAPPLISDGIPRHMTLLASDNAEDTDGNGYRDTIHVSAAIFDRGSRTVEADGAFVFEVHPRGRVNAGEPMFTWRFEPEQVRNAAALAAYGRCYRFRLSLQNFGGDELPSIPSQITGYYETDSGQTIRCSNELRPVTLGPV